MRPDPAAPSGCVYELSGQEAVIPAAEQLFESLRARRQAYGSDKVPVIIEPREDVPWRYVVEAFNQALRAEFRNVGLAPRPGAAGGGTRP